ncbi:MAG: hypothetical protein NC548_18090 [Lachnospiraceae bacterium]|nr:hypothetical protein [Lachnospiraceae bacterium]
MLVPLIEKGKQRNNKAAKGNQQSYIYKVCKAHLMKIEMISKAVINATSF